MSLPKSWVELRRGISLERRDEHVHVEDVNAHRGEHLLAAGQVLRFLEKAGQPSFAVDLQDAEALRFVRGDLDRGQRRARASLAVEAQHLRVVHLVDVIAREHDQVPRVLAQDRIEVLVDGVRGSQIPVLADALLRAEDFDELAELVGDDAPAHPEVPAERQRFVLQRDEDLAQAGVDAVAQREVDDAIRPAEVHRRLRALFRERIQPFADASRQHHDHHIVQHVIVLPVLA